MKKSNVIFLTYCLIIFLFPFSLIADNGTDFINSGIENSNTKLNESENPIKNDGYELVWIDSFDGDALNEENWVIEIDGKGGGNKELQYYREENISVEAEPVTEKNCLVITAKKESFAGRSATSGRLKTQGKQAFKYGKIEASIKLPKTADGLWPAFWLLGADFASKGWPACGEIDILEMGNVNGIKNGTQNRYFNGACHWGVKWGNMRSDAKHYTSDYGLQDDFHLFTMIWDEQNISMYLDLDKNPDAEPYFKMDITQKDTELSAGKYFHKEYFIIFNLAVGGNFPEIWDINQITALNKGEAKMYVDFVRVYQKKKDL